MINYERAGEFEVVYIKLALLLINLIVKVLSNSQANCIRPFSNHQNISTRLIRLPKDCLHSYCFYWLAK